MARKAKGTGERVVQQQQEGDDEIEREKSNERCLDFQNIPQSSAWLGRELRTSRPSRSPNALRKGVLLRVSLFGFHLVDVLVCAGIRLQMHNGALSQLLSSQVYNILPISSRCGYYYYHNGEHNRSFRLLQQTTTPQAFKEQLFFQSLVSTLYCSQKELC